jgi:hypothetical protein
MALRIRGVRAKPSRARRIAGSNNLAQGSLPWRPWASAISRILPGTPTLFPPGTAWRYGSGFPSGPKNQLGEAASGAVSRPS